MKSNLGHQLQWRDLDLARMPFWPNAPRRWLLALLAGLLLLAFMMALVWPQAQRLRSELNHIQSLQQQIHQTLSMAPSTLAQVPPARMIRNDEGPAWLADLASSARARQLSAVTLKVSEPSESQRQELRGLIRFVMRKNGTLSGNEENLAMDWINQTGLLELSVQGRYADILSLLDDLGAHDEWLAIESSALEAIGTDQVRWHIQLWYFKEMAVKNEWPDATK